MKFNRIAVFALIAIFCGVSACSKSENDGASAQAKKEDAFVERGEGNVLSSGAFGVSVAIPDAWYSMSFEELNALVDEGSDVATAGNDQLAAVVEASEKNSFNLFGVLKYETGSPVDENPNVMGMAEKIAFQPGIKRGTDYFFHVKKLMQQSSLTLEFEEEYKTRMIDGVEFDQMDLTQTINGIAMGQSYLAARNGDFMYLFIQTYISEEGQQETSAVVDKIKLDW